MYQTSIRFLKVIAAFTGLALVAGCSSSGWDDARQADTYQAYQTYITDHPQGQHAAEAQQRADSLYWNSIKTDTAATVFEQYLDKFPNGRYRANAQAKHNKLSNTSTKASVTGSNVIIRSDHTTESLSAGVVAKEGTVVQILDQYNSGNGNEVLLKHDITISVHNKHINLASGKAIRVLSVRGDWVHASILTSEFGRTEATINKADVENMNGETWYKIRTNDNITGWIYGKFIAEL